MLQLNTRAVLAVVATGVALFMLSGCGLLEARQAEAVANQGIQLQKFIEQADAWGADIVAQVPAPEASQISENIGGSRQAGANYEEWPKYYYWSQIVELHPDARTPTEFADGLEPWLEEQGWERNIDSGSSPGEESFVRSYSRGRYSLAVEIYTVSPPQAQSLNFSIVSPDTDPNS